MAETMSSVHNYFISAPDIQKHYISQPRIYFQLLTSVGQVFECGLQNSPAILGWLSLCSLDHKPEAKNPTEPLRSQRHKRATG